MAASRWVVAPSEAGMRLDRFRAAADRVGSRARAASALERGKIFLNDAEAGLALAARPLVAGDVVSLWSDRPGSSRAPTRSSTGNLGIVYEDAALLVLNKPS